MRDTCSTSCKSSRMYSSVCNFASARIMPLNKLVASATTSRSKWHMRRTRARTATASLGRARRSQILLGAAAPARQGRPRKVQVCKPLLQAVPRRRQDQTDHQYLKHAVRLVDANMFSLVRELVWYRPASSPEHKKNKLLLMGRGRFKRIGLLARWSVAIATTQTQSRGSHAHATSRGS
jgi:hypothetical protein